MSVDLLPPKTPGALCREHDPDMWFDRSTASKAIAICRECPDIAPCFEFAMSRPLHGIWGGRTANWRTKYGAPAVRQAVP